MNLTAVGLIKMPKVWLATEAADQTYDNVNLDATTLLWTAAVVRNRCHISNRVDADTESAQSTH